LITHPNVADAGVVGVKVNGLELPRAYIVLRKPAKDAAAQHLVAKEVQEWVKPRVGKPKHLRGGVIIIPEIPRRSVICAVAVFCELEADLFF
jgi:4-coumarate--CoA ligase